MCVHGMCCTFQCVSLSGWGFTALLPCFGFFSHFFFGMCAHTLETEERREARGAAAPALQKGMGDGGVPFLLGSLLWVSPLQQGL